MKKSKILTIIVLLFAVALFFVFDLNTYFTLESIKNFQTSFEGFYTNNAVLVIAVFFLLYTLMAALSLPGAALLTLLAGALFGFVTGTVIVSFASSLGATLAALLARYLFRSSLEKKFEKQIKAINKGIKKEGPFYLFSLRLIPIFPFFVINIVFGLTKLKLKTFYWVSQVGMLAGTMVYVNAGKELGKLDSLAGILSPTLIISFVALGLFPLIVKKLLGLYKSKVKGDKHEK